MRRRSDIPLLGDGTVTLRPHREEDVDDIVDMCRDRDFARWTSVPQPYTRDHAKRFVREIIPEGWRDGGFRGWAIEACDLDGRERYAGNVDVRGVPVADIGFGLHPWARRRGLMTRAVRLAAQWAFDRGDVAARRLRGQ